MEVTIFVIGVAFLIVMLFRVTPKKERGSKSFPTKVVGTTFGKRQKNIKKYVEVGDELIIEEYTYEGARAFSVKTSNGKDIGNISADIASRETIVSATVKNITGGGNGNYGVNIIVYAL